MQDQPANDALEARHREEETEAQRIRQAEKQGSEGQEQTQADKEPQKETGGRAGKESQERKEE